MLYEVESASGEAALNEIRAELKSQGYLKYYKQRDKRQKPADFLRFTSSDGFEILVGRNNAQNDKLTLHTARGKDLWFHVQKAPGSHVVVMSHGEDIPDTTKQEAAELAGVSVSTVTKWMQSGEFQCVGAGKVLRVHRQQFLNWLNEHREGVI